MTRRLSQSTWTQWMPPGSANRHFVGAALIVTATLGGWWYWQPRTMENHVCLLSGTRLNPGDLDRVELAFGAAGLNDYQICDGQILVPPGERDRYSKVLQDGKALPDSSREMYEPEAQSPWATADQRQEAALLRKKKTIRRLVLELNFVADAIVDYDEATEAGWPPQTRRSAAIVVRPQDGRLLESFQIDAIRNTICGAVAGLDPADIVITDIAAGLAYVGESQAAERMDSDALWHIEGARLEQRLNDQLLPLGSGIRVSVRLSQPRPGQDVAHEFPMTLTTGNAPVPLANQPATLASDPPGEPASDESASLESNPRPIAIHVSIPPACVESFAPDGRSPKESIKYSLEQKFQEMKERVHFAMQPILDGKKSQWIAHAIEIELGTPDAPAAALAGRSNSVWTDQARWIPFALLAMALVLGTRLLLGRQREMEPRQFKQQSPSDARDRLGTSRVSGDASSIPDSMRRTLRDLVDDDPDAAAQVIEQWIRDAA